MKLNAKRFEANVRHYLESDDAEPVWREFDGSILLNLIGSLIALIIGLVLVCTIYFAWTGLKMLGEVARAFVTLEIFRDERRLIQSHPEWITPLVTAGIIIGPRGHGLVLGSFARETQEELTFLGRKARELADLYTEGSDREVDQPLFAMLRDDIARPHRRREVPASHAEGRALVIFDVEIDVEKAFAANEVVWVACVAVTKPDQEDVTPPKGEIAQIPWSVVAGAVSRGGRPPALVPDLPSD